MSPKVRMYEFKIVTEKDVRYSNRFERGKAVTQGVAIAAVLCTLVVGCGSKSSGSAEENNSPKAASSDSPGVGVTPPSPSGTNAPDTHSPEIATTTTPIPPVIESGTKGWKTEPEAQAKANPAASLFADMDSNLKALRNARITFDLAGSLPEGKGTYNNSCVIADDKRYRISYSLFSKTPVPHFEEYTVTQREGKTVTFEGGKPSPGRKLATKVNLDDLPLTITHHISSAIASELNPMSAIYQAAKNAGWKISLESRQFESGVFKRVIMVSNSEPRKKYEFVVNPSGKMPTTVRLQIEDPKRPVLVNLNLKYEQSSTALTEKDLSMSAPSKEFNRMRTDEAIAKDIEKLKGKAPK